MSAPTTIEEYIQGYEPNTRLILQTIRETIHMAAPEATETISYAIPTFQQGGKNLVHFAAYPSHIGFYATPDGHVEFEEELKKYKRGKGSVQFPIDEPMPLDLIARITHYRSEHLNEGE